MAYTRTALVTGGTFNLGYHAALEIAKKKPDWLVVVASRSDKERAAEKINNSTNQQNAIFLPLDLSNSQKARAFAKEWPSRSFPPIQALVFNAALQFPGETELTDEGIEKTFAISHVGHAVLLHNMIPHLAPGARVTIVASGVHDPAQKSGLPDAVYTKAEDLVDPPAAMRASPGTQHYTNTKLANVLLTYALARRFEEQHRDIRVNAFDPGLMPGTGLAREYKQPLRWVWYHVFPRITPLLRAVYTPNIHKPSESGASLARLAVGEGDTEGEKGKYYEGRKAIQSSDQSYDVAKQDDLWRWTVNFVAEDEAEVAKFERFE